MRRMVVDLMPFSRQMFETVVPYLMASAPSASVTTAAVLCALDYLDEWQKAVLVSDNMRAQIKDCLEDAAKPKLAAEEARREVERLRRELEQLKEGKQ